MTKAFNPSMRHHSRLEIGGALSAKVLPRSLEVEVRNVSLGGAQTISGLPFERGAKHGLKFVCRSADPLFLRARVVYCLPDAIGSSFTTGWAWAWDTTSTETVHALLNHVTGDGHLAESSEPRDAARQR